MRIRGLQANEADLFASNRVSAQLLGLDIRAVGQIPPPPQRRGHYEKWCAEHRVLPYGALELEAQHGRSRTVDGS
ncbi:MAG TPA: hypothetical protein VHV82_15300 [Sporichthyaceae bacterium]|jgi:hypothetical protein|nr:hypothetical protein [Sporichthyaceae bacterium]